MRLGKHPARPGAVRLKFRTYANLSRLPTPPANFGHGGLLRTDLGMLGNDNAGDCVWAGAAHETKLWVAEAGSDVTFDDQSVLSDYSAVTGYNPADPNTDQGTDVQQAASYRLKTGILDAHGKRHKIGAYLALTPGDLEEHAVAAYLFGAVGIGITFPNSAMDQFNGGQPWDPVQGSQIDGGHYVPLVGRFSDWLIIVTWGRENAMTPAFLKSQNDESLVYLSPEMLTNGKSLEGFDLQQLQDDLKAL